MDAFEAAIREDPTDPIPYLRVARIQRDRLGDNDEAARWFNRALSRSEMHPGLTMLRRVKAIIARESEGA